MRKIFFAFLFIFITATVSAQCLDALVRTNGDTIVGIVTAVTDTSYTIDSYNFVVSFRKEMIKDYIKCYRDITHADILRMRQVDYLTEQDLFKYTPGYYLRKSSRSFYLGLSLEIVGGIALGFSVGIDNNSSHSAQKWILFSGGTLAMAGGVFFLLRSFYFIDKTGKILDMERSALYLESDKDKQLGLIWKF
ncbi:MAG: hypothetical protein LBQ64_02385 [Bacteroidales bacterium]|jgi:hypothetical protein|nr:hypothetical protein [Bacteroidales bacterium]